MSRAVAALLALSLGLYAASLHPGVAVVVCGALAVLVCCASLALSRPPVAGSLLLCAAYALALSSSGAPIDAGALGFGAGIVLLTDLAVLPRERAVAAARLRTVVPNALVGAAAGALMLGVAAARSGGTTLVAGAAAAAAVILLARRVLVVVSDSRG